MKKLVLAWVTLFLCGATPQTAKNESQDPPSWTEPTAPFHIAGPIYYVGTSGIGVYLLKSDAGLILLSGAPRDATEAIVASIKKLGFKPEEIRFILSSHAHFDHAGTLASFKNLTHGRLVVMDADVDLLKSGGKLDFLFSKRPRFWFEGVEADNVIKDNEKVTLGNITLTAHLTPGHTKGCTTWQMNVEEGGRTFQVVFADGVGINPGTRFVQNPSYPNIASDYERTFKTLEKLKPDIFLSYHAEFFDLDAKRQRMTKEGVNAWVDPTGYREQIAKRKASFAKAFTEEKTRNSNPDHKSK